MRRSSRSLPMRPVLALLLAVVAVAVSGCASTVSLTPAAASNDPGCAEVLVRLPGQLDGKQRRWTDAQATAAWGDPSAVLLTCGVTPPGPTTLRCETVSGVDWVIDETDAPKYRVTTFGRTPAIELYIDTENTAQLTGVSSRVVLDALSPIVAQLPKNAACVPRADATPVP
ncbi:DUF3515 family protein [Microbacterium sp. CJ88]|uniref:DUF3515 family protein n=1 Tax=Microbacterium sp. CJ88 TaxID=3445672 RepID=UPI003F65533B